MYCFSVLFYMIVIKLLCAASWFVIIVTPGGSNKNVKIVIKENLPDGWLYYIKDIITR